MTPCSDCIHRSGQKDCLATIDRVVLGDWNAFEGKYEPGYTVYRNFRHVNTGPGDCPKFEKRVPLEMPAPTKTRRRGVVNRILSWMFRW